MAFPSASIAQQSHLLGLSNPILVRLLAHKLALKVVVSVLVASILNACSF